jgi:hypothetical protein
VAELDPIRQLQHLIDDPDKVLDKISSIRSVLGAIKTMEPALSTGTHGAAAANPSPPAPGDEEHPFARLLQTLRDMQVQIEEELRPLVLQIVQAETEYLRRQAEQVQSALNDCLARIDRSITACYERIEQSSQTYAQLTELNRCLTQLGGAPASLPKDPCFKNPTALIYSRLEKLTREGKL